MAHTGPATFAVPAISQQPETIRPSERVVATALPPKRPQLLARGPRQDRDVVLPVRHHDDAAVCIHELRSVQQPLAHKPHVAAVVDVDFLQSATNTVPRGVMQRPPRSHAKCPRPVPGPPMVRSGAPVVRE